MTCRILFVTAALFASATAAADGMEATAAENGVETTRTAEVAPDRSRDADAVRNLGLIAAFERGTARALISGEGETGIREALARVDDGATTGSADVAMARPRLADAPSTALGIDALATVRPDAPRLVRRAPARPHAAATLVARAESNESDR